MAIRFWRSFAVLFCLIFIAATLIPYGVAEAGFGITPPYVNNHRLTRGTIYEQKITLVRSDPNEDLKTQITINVPGIDDWFTVDRGNEFILPKGTTQVPIVIRVKVPENAAYQNYTGAIRIRTSAVDIDSSGGGVSIALGAQIDVDLEVVDKIFDFDVRKIRIADMEEGRWKWGLFFPGKIRFFMTIENTGNTDFGPTKVRFDIYDREMETLLESTENTNKIERIAPFSIREVIAELPTHLGAGTYKGKYTIFKNEDIAQQNVVDISISAKGAVVGYEGYGFNGLSLQDKLKVIAILGLPLLVLLILVAILISKRRRAVRSRYDRRRI